jgi:hypothetical protein
MTPGDFLTHLRGLGVELTPDGENVRVRAPGGALTAELRQGLASEKAALLYLLRVERGLCVGCGAADWVVSLVGSDGGRTCAACAIGRTAARRSRVDQARTAPRHRR